MLATFGVSFTLNICSAGQRSRTSASTETRQHSMKHYNVFSGDYFPMVPLVRTGPLLTCLFKYEQYLITLAVLA